MNFSEFKKLLGADPWNRDSETLRLRNSAPEFEQAAAEAEAFEKKLQSSVLVNPPGDLLNNILEISHKPVRSSRWMPMALAASLIIAVGAMGIVWNQSTRWESVEAYLAEHYLHDGASTVANASGTVSAEEVNRIMASLNASARPDLSSKVRFIKFCPTPDGRGAHMVVSTEQGPVTIIFMPQTDVTNGELLQFDQMQAFLVDLEHGSAAIIGDLSQPVENLETVVRTSLISGEVGA